MNDVLLDAFRHNSWATKRLLAVCRTLSEDHLTAGAPSSFGSILATLNHMMDPSVKTAISLKISAVPPSTTHTMLDTAD